METPDYHVAISRTEDVCEKRYSRYDRTRLLYCVFTRRAKAKDSKGKKTSARDDTLWPKETAAMPAMLLNF
jgi:hypothetical protein